MIFWDSSALVPLILFEKESAQCRDFLKKDSEMVVWALSPTEMLSSLFRKQREGAVSDPEIAEARQRLSQLQKGWAEVIVLEAVRAKANRLLAVHPLRAADALQLAAALTAFEDRPEGEIFLTFDKRLSDAAQREGFGTGL